MKKRTISILTMAIGMMAISIYFTACKKSDDSTPAASGKTDAVARVNPNSVIFPIGANMYGKSYGQWSAEWWKWVFAFDCAHLPLIDHTGALQNQHQSGPVFFLGGSGGTTESRYVTIPADKAIMFPLVNYYSNYPCGSGVPAAGETLEHFLTAQVQPILPLMDQLSLNIDGNTIDNLTDYVSLSSVFNYTGNPDLASCYDPCITGNVQQAVTGGYMIMLKPLPAGQHTVHFTGGATSFNFLVDITYHLTIQ